jgi:hypothetical protein
VGFQKVKKRAVIHHALNRHSVHNFLYKLGAAFLGDQSNLVFSVGSSKGNFLDLGSIGNEIPIFKLSQISLCNDALIGASNFILKQIKQIILLHSDQSTIQGTNACASYHVRSLPIAQKYLNCTYLYATLEAATGASKDQFYSCVCKVSYYLKYSSNNYYFQ